MPASFQLIVYAELLNIGTGTSTKVEKKTNYAFSDGAEISSEVTSKTTFVKNRRRHGPSYNLEGMAMLVEAVATVDAEVATEEAEREIRMVWWVNYMTFSSALLILSYQR